MDLADSYYAHKRPEVQALVPEAAHYVVDVGCASGALGKDLKAGRPGLEVRGVEPQPVAAELARTALDDVLVATADAPLPDDWPAPDCVIFADVLEHLEDPWATLGVWCERLAPGGCIVASIPNVAHHSVIRGLMAGRFDYVDAGILDRTHLRFFTRQTIDDMFSGAGLHVRRLERVIDRRLLARASHWLGRLGEGAERKGGPLRRLADPWTVQFLVVATPSASPI
jgi:2-polyprenyl-3-methyl-5-hydroxy-6-metoxy-1,4-benzoquinol methylase